MIYMKKKLTALFFAVCMCFNLSAFADNITDEVITEAEFSVAEKTDTEETNYGYIEEATMDDVPTVTKLPVTTYEPVIDITPQATAVPVPTQAPVYTNPELMSTTVNIEIDLLQYPSVKESTVEIELYSMSNAFLGKLSEPVTAGKKKIHMCFLVPQYTLGESFKVRLVSGLNSIKYYEDVYYPLNEFVISTYYYTNEYGVIAKGNSFNFEGDPYKNKEIVMYDKWGMMELDPEARLIDGITYVPVRQVAEALGLDVRYDERYRSVVVSVGDKEVAYNIDSEITNYFGVDKLMNGSTRSIEGSVFIPVRSLAEAFEASIEVLDFGDHLDVILGESQLRQEFLNSFPINRDGIGSKTDYLVWVSKHEYKVRVFTGQVRNWTLVAEFPCAIGAPDTPTITGQYDYFSRESRWEYEDYYVGPIMRFYNGYALHSTLLNYRDGSEYDGRVGVMISHGCVRLHPEDIQWLVDMVPLYTRIYVTE